MEGMETRLLVPQNERCYIILKIIVKGTENLSLVSRPSKDYRHHLWYPIEDQYSDKYHELRNS